MGDSGSPNGRSLGRHIASRLVQLGAQHFFAVPGDYNLALLDELILERRWQMINTCNELNAGYAADGYARSKGFGVVVVTFTVGGLSLINAIAGAYAENLPIICIVGCPNSNDFSSGRVLHHTTGDPTDFMQELQCFKRVTCDQVVIQHVDKARALIDRAIINALRNHKPVYIAVCANIAGLPHPSFGREPIPFRISMPTSNQDSLEAAVKATCKFLAAAPRAVLLAGMFLRAAQAQAEFHELADSSGLPVAVMSAAKGMFDESHRQYIGQYWGSISSPGVAEMVESADALLLAGPLINDYTSVGYTTLINPAKAVVLDGNTVTVAAGKGGQVFGCVLMHDFLRQLAKEIRHDTKVMDAWQRLADIPTNLPDVEADAALQTKYLFKHVQGVLRSDHVVLAETGDSIFNCMKLRLPSGCGYEWQPLYGSIGWSVGASLGVAAAEGGKRRLLAFIGDGSFQVTAQDVSSMLRFGLNPVIFLLNNMGYTIEAQIHDGPYNYIQNWNYTALVEALNNEQGKLFTAKARTLGQFREAVEAAENQHLDKLCFIECVIERDDCSRELLEWGARLQAATSRVPVHH